MHEPSPAPADRYRHNQLWLAEAAPALFQWLDQAEAAQTVRLEEGRLQVSGECWLEQAQPQLAAALQQQLSIPDGVSVPLVSNPPAAVPPPGELLAAAIDQHQAVLLNALPNLMAPAVSAQKPHYRSLAVLGSLMLEPLARSLAAGSPLPWQSLILLEDDPRQLAAALHLLDLPALVQALRAAGVGLELICESEAAALQDRFFSLISSEQPLALHGLQLLRSPQRSPALMELHSWLHAPEGCCQQAVGMLGFATDELNQTLQAVWSALANRPARLLQPQVLPADHPVVLVASGPSLDDQLPWLREHQQQLTIVAAGSALGSLLQAGIRPAAVVYLERATNVYRQLCDLAADAVDFRDILLIGSSTLDPRVPALFADSLIFHRPMAAASRCFFPAEQTALLPQAGPHVANAALEALLVLGCRRLLLVGCDFGTSQRGRDRAARALGTSPRDLSLAIAGNRGRTVFSEPQLLFAQQCFERMLVLLQGLDVRRLGEGVVLRGSVNAETGAELLAQMAADPAVFRSLLLSRLPEAPLPHLSAPLAANLAATQAQLQAVRELLGGSEGWSHRFASAASALVTRDQPELPVEQQFAHALLAQPLFFLLGPLYHAAPDQWQVERERACQSLSVLEGLLAAYEKLLEQFLRIPRLPGWDPEWLRARCRALDQATPA